MDSFFQLKACRRTGVLPRGAQVRLTGGFWERPLSSRKTTHARQILEFFLLFPRLSLPLTDLLFISFLGLQRRSLQTPIHLTQDFPHMPRVIAHPGDAVDELRYAGQRPQLCFPPMSGSPSKQFLLHQRQLFLVQSGLSASSRGPVQRLCIPVVPCQPPLAYALATDPQVLSDATLPLALLEKRDRLQASLP